MARHHRRSGKDRSSNRHRSPARTSVNYRRPRSRSASPSRSHRRKRDRSSSRDRDHRKRGERDEGGSSRLVDRTRHRGREDSHQSKSARPPLPSQGHIRLQDNGAKGSRRGRERSRSRDGHRRHAGRPHSPSGLGPPVPPLGGGHARGTSEDEYEADRKRPRLEAYYSPERSSRQAHSRSRSPDRSRSPSRSPLPPQPPRPPRPRGARSPGYSRQGRSRSPVRDVKVSKGRSTSRGGDSRRSPKPGRRRSASPGHSRRSLSPLPPRPPPKPRRLRSRSRSLASSQSSGRGRYGGRKRARSRSFDSQDSPRRHRSYSRSPRRRRQRDRTASTESGYSRRRRLSGTPPTERGRSRTRSPSASIRSRSSSLPPHRRGDAPSRSVSPLPPIMPKRPGRRDSFEAILGPPPQPPKPPRGPRNGRFPTSSASRADGLTPPAFPASMAGQFRKPIAPTQPRQWRAELENAPKGPRSQAGQPPAPLAPPAPTSVDNVSPKVTVQAVQPILTQGLTKSSSANSGIALPAAASANVRKFFPGDDDDIDGSPVVPPPKPLAGLPAPADAAAAQAQRRSRSRSWSRSPDGRHRRERGRWNRRKPYSYDDRGRSRYHDRSRSRTRSPSGSRSPAPPEPPKRVWGPPPSAKSWRTTVGPAASEGPINWGTAPPPAADSQDTSREASAPPVDAVGPAPGTPPGPPPADEPPPRAAAPAGPEPVTAPAPSAAHPEPCVAPPSAPALPKEAYQRLSQVGEGTYGKVYKARDVETGVLVAMKRIRMESEKDGFPVTSIREIKLLQSLRHPNIVSLIEMVVSHGSVYMVFEYLDHDLSGILHHPNVNFNEAHVKSLTWQLLAGLQYMHGSGVLHRDLKGSNLLLNRAGELKITDFGLARRYDRGRVKGKEGKGRGRDYTNRVITLWYKPPELLLGATVYGEEVDMWSAGAIFLELFTKRAVFQAGDEIDQLHNTFKIIGSPTPETWPGATALPWYELVKPKAALPSRLRSLLFGPDAPVKMEGAMQLAERLLAMNPARRPSAQEALASDYFTTELPKMEPPSGLLANIDGEWHEWESKAARKGHRRWDNM